MDWRESLIDEVAVEKDHGARRVLVGALALTFGDSVGVAVVLRATFYCEARGGCGVGEGCVVVGAGTVDWRESLIDEVAVEEDHGGRWVQV